MPIEFSTNGHTLLLHYKIAKYKKSKSYLFFKKTESVHCISPDCYGSVQSSQQSVSLPVVVTSYTLPMWRFNYGYARTRYMVSLG